MVGLYLVRQRIYAERTTPGFSSRSIDGRRLKFAWMVVGVDRDLHLSLLVRDAAV